MSLPERLTARITREGAITVAQFMEACLHDPEDGYYASRPALGADGDFITAPHVSQMFGELLGLWAAEIWRQLGAPNKVRLVEIGPGDGTLLGDVLRAAKAAPGFREAIDLWLVESSAPLRRRQAEILARAGVRAQWTSELGEIPADAPIIVLSNEFLDCLPILQAVWTGSVWRERRIGLGPSGGLAFEAGDVVALPAPEGGGCGAVREYSPALEAFGQRMGALIARASGAALFIDYGRAAPELGDTLQALRGHRKEGPFERPGGADLTAHVDFPAFVEAARAGGGLCAPVLTQGEFLRALGIETRAAALARRHPEQAGLLDRQMERLIGADRMGRLFKVAAVSSAGLAPPGFPSP